MEKMDSHTGPVETQMQQWGAKIDEFLGKFDGIKNTGGRALGDLKGGLGKAIHEIEVFLRVTHHDIKHGPNQRQDRVEKSNGSETMQGEQNQEMQRDNDGDERQTGGASLDQSQPYRRDRDPDLDVDLDAEQSVEQRTSWKDADDDYDIEVDDENERSINTMYMSADDRQDRQSAQDKKIGAREPNAPQKNRGSASRNRRKDDA